MSDEEYIKFLGKTNTNNVRSSAIYNGGYTTTDSRVLQNDGLFHRKKPGFIRDFMKMNGSVRRKIGNFVAYTCRDIMEAMGCSHIWPCNEIRDSLRVDFGTEVLCLTAEEATAAKCEALSGKDGAVTGIHVD